MNTNQKITLKIVAKKSDSQVISASLDNVCDGKLCGLGKYVGGSSYVCPHNNLLVLHPELCNEWDYSKNIESPDKVTSGSSKKVWWRCKVSPCECHSWETKIKERTKRQSRCPFCYGDKNCIHDNFTITHPDVFSEWDHERNNIDPATLSRGSSVVVWWKCKVSPCECHRWQTSISHRTGVKSGCPFCTRNQNCPHNNITITHPELAREWDYERNDKLPTECTYGMDHKIWWKCTKGTCDCHRWEATIQHRSIRGDGCPFCVRNRVCPHNNLLVNQPELCLEWYYERNRTRPEEHNDTSNEKVWWKCCRAKCECHRWEATIHNRTSGTNYNRTSGTNCPYCFQSKTCPHFNLLIVRPEIAAEWDYDKNIDRPENYSSGSGICVWWKCKDNPNHLWETQITCRTSPTTPTGCPHCAPKRYSKIQIKWLNGLMGTDHINILHAENTGEFKIDNVGFVDGYCKETNTVYEFHGDYYHGHPSKYPSDEINPTSNKTYGELYEKTLRRDQAIRDAGYNLITMWEHEYLALQKNK